MKKTKVKLICVKIDVNVRVPWNTDLNDVVVDLNGLPELMVLTNGGLREVSHSIPSWTIDITDKKTVVFDNETSR